MKRVLLLLAFSPALLLSQVENPLAQVRSPKQALESEMAMPVLNNRILTRINGEPISLYDVIRKMDFVFFQQFPQYVDSVPARLQFYQAQWRTFFDMLVEEKLLLADAKEKGLEVRDGEVREELERIFGPNVVQNIDAAGLTFQEAWDMIRQSLIVQRITYFSVQMKAMGEISPEKIRTFYSSNLEKFATPASWEYQVLTVEGQDEFETAHLANQAFEALFQKGATPTSVQKMVEKESKSNTSLRASSLFNRHDQELASHHKEKLQALQPGECSVPEALEKEDTNAYRLFYLHSFHPEQYKPIEEVEAVISERLLSESIQQYSDQYIADLRKRFGVDKNQLQESIPSDYTPFIVM